MPQTTTQKILTIHGIRSDKWYSDFKQLLSKRTDVEVINFDYGYFSLGKFLRGSKRNEVISMFQVFYSDNFDPNDPPHVICHSFGTYIFFSSIRKYTSIKFNKVLLCGSILKRKLNWQKYFDRGQIKMLYNDYGGLDGIVSFSPIVIRECGNSGKYGFKNIPDTLQSKVVQTENYFGHSDYFFPLHIKENWIPKLVRNSKQFKFDNRILRPEIIDRIYSNQSEQEFSFSDVRYNARIDEQGNYFAQYSKKGTNITNRPINAFSFITTADSREQADDMGFKAFERNGKIVYGNIQVDKVQNKTCSFPLKKPISPGLELDIFYFFKWRETMTFKDGDTDHFDIKHAKNVYVNLNFRFTLINPRIFIISDKEIIQDFTPRKSLEKDGSHSYYFEYINENNYDGIIFYYESANFSKFEPIPKELKSFRKGVEEIVYSTCSLKDIQGIYILESEIEHGNAASEKTLYERLSMFNEGFIIAKHKNKIVGYIETVVWNDISFERFDEIKDFPLFYDTKGDTLYVIFLGVGADYRRRGIGQKLLEHAKDLAIKNNVDKMQLVAKEDLITFYGNFNFEVVRELPDFLQDRNYKSTLMNRKIK